MTDSGVWSEGRLDYADARLWPASLPLVDLSPSKATRGLSIQ